MNIDKVCCSEKAKRVLSESIENKKISHAQLIAGKNGRGALELALAYALDILNDVNLGINHPDLHFVFPINTTKSYSKVTLSDELIVEFKRFIKEKPYGNLSDWYSFIQLENKQGIISSAEAEQIRRKLSLKSYCGSYKIVIIWHAEKMNESCSNKLLKIIEEPPEDTLILLTTDSPQDILPTISSRVQKIVLSDEKVEDIAAFLSLRFNIEPEKALKTAICSSGDLGFAISLSKGENKDENFENLFVKWVRAAFKAKKNASALRDLIQWAEEIDSLGREKQKEFLIYSQNIFRQAMLENYQKALRTSDINTAGFNFSSFSNFVTGSNIEDINRCLEDALLHISRNGAAKIVFLDTSIQITRLLHRPTFN